MDNKEPMSKEQIKAALQQAGVSCRSCWWREGDRCYVEPCTRTEDGRSTKLATEVCAEHTSKRSVLSQVFPNDMLWIASEQGSKNGS